MRTFHRVLVNTVLANITTNLVWFGLVFWAYLQTRSVLITSVLGGGYLLFIAFASVPFGTLIDRVRKKTAMVIATIGTLAAFVVALVMFLIIPTDVLLDMRGVAFWAFVVVVLLGTIVESIRNLALATCVTLLVPPEGRPKANGLVGMVMGIGMALNSVLSGFAVGYLGMTAVLVIGVLFITVSGVHLLGITIDEPEIATGEAAARVNLREAFAMTRAIPGLMGLVVFSTLNNLIGGVFSGLLDPYGLELVSVQTWGLLWSLLSLGYILGGLLIQKTGLGQNPVRTLLLANIAMWTLAGSMVIRESIVLVVVGVFIYMGLITYAEASEQTVLQKVVPFAQQGRVFGFAQAIELSAAPVSALAVGPIAEFWLIPYMASDAGKDRFGWLLGEGTTRGMALVFMAAGVIGLVLTVLALLSKPYRTLSRTYEVSTVNEGQSEVPDAPREPASEVFLGESDVLDFRD